MTNLWPAQYNALWSPCKMPYMLDRFNQICSFDRQIFLKFRNIKFHEYPSRGNDTEKFWQTDRKTEKRTDRRRDRETDRCTDRQTEKRADRRNDMKKLTDTHRDYAKALQKNLFDC
jgi:hypothetical protein